MGERDDQLLEDIVGEVGRGVPSPFLLFGCLASGGRGEGNRMTTEVAVRTTNLSKT
jgi:hypothetical protein